MGYIGDLLLVILLCLVDFCIVLLCGGFVACGYMFVFCLGYVCVNWLLGWILMTCWFVFGLCCLDSGFAGVLGDLI